MATVAVAIFLANNTHADSAKDLRGCWKRGYVVDAYDVGARGWADDGSVLPPCAEMVLPKFAWLYLYGVSLAKVKRFVAEQHDTSDGIPASGSKIARRRLYRVEVDSIPLAIRNIVLNTGRLNVGGPNANVTWNQVRGFIRNLKDNLTEADRGTTAADLA